MKDFLQKLQVLLDENDARITRGTGDSESILVKFGVANRPYLEFKNEINVLNIGKLDFVIRDGQYKTPTI